MNANWFCSLRGPFKNICVGLTQLHFYPIPLPGHCRPAEHYSRRCQPVQTPRGSVAWGIIPISTSWQTAGMGLYSYKTELCINNFSFITFLENTSREHSLDEGIWNVFLFIQPSWHCWKTELWIWNGAFNTQIWDGHGSVDKTLCSHRTGVLWVKLWAFLQQDSEYHSPC